jgi:hypothetical protein
MVRRLDLRDDGHPVQPAVVVAQEEQGSWCNGLKVSNVKKIIGPVFYIILKYPVFHLSCKHSIYFKVSYLNLKLCYYIRPEFYVIFSSTTIVVRGVGKKIRTWVLPNFIGPRCQAATCTIKLTGFPAS